MRETVKSAFIFPIHQIVLMAAHQKDFFKTKKWNLVWCGYMRQRRKRLTLMLWRIYFYCGKSYWRSWCGSSTTTYQTTDSKTAFRFPFNFHSYRNILKEEVLSIFSSEVSLMLLCFINNESLYGRLRRHDFKNVFILSVYLLCLLSSFKTVFPACCIYYDWTRNVFPEFLMGFLRRQRVLVYLF